MTKPLATEDKPTAGEAADPPLEAHSAEADTPLAEVAPAEAPPRRARSRPFQALFDLLHDLAVAAVVCIFLITYVMQAFKVQGTSMSPQLVDGQRILVNKFIYRFKVIERGDVVVFWYPDDPDVSFIKRVIGLPGDLLEIRRGEVLVNGEPLAEIYVSPENADARTFPPQTVREGHYFVAGDNRRGSNDSRSWGLVPKRYVYGKAFVRVWPLGKFGPIH